MSVSPSVRLSVTLVDCDHTVQQVKIGTQQNRSVSWLPANGSLRRLQYHVNAVISNSTEELSYRLAIENVEFLHYGGNSLRNRTSYVSDQYKTLIGNRIRRI